MDKSWMSKSKWSSDYIEGVETFLEFATKSQSSTQKILCPCKLCVNRYFHYIKDVKLHLLSKGIFPGYVVWNRHGEEHTYLAEVTRSEICTDTTNVVEAQAQGEQHRTNDIEELLRDTFCADNVNLDDEDNENNIGMLNDEAKRHDDLLLEAGAELYPGCKSFTKLSFILQLFRLKCLHSWSARSFDQLIELLIEAFPNGSLLPKNTYEVKKIMKVFDLGYIKIDACPNDCCLFWKDRSNQEVCHICGSSRWAGAKKSTATKKKKQMKSAKVVRYFPLIPRLQRLFKTKKSAEEMTWHAKQRNVDGLLRHPADGEAWKSFDSRYPDFASDPRNVRLALASDGFNPYKNMSSTYSIWPVLLVPYNMPPWITMKQSSFILSTIIPGEKSPGNNIDVYLQPLINELHELWNGVISYDAASRQSFNLRAVLMWTINDFPAYSMLSGWSTKGRFACPCCAENTESLWLYKGKKFSYMGHRRWLPENHLFRRQKQYFDNTEEIRKAPIRNTGTYILQKLQNVQFPLGKAKSLKRGRNVDLSEHHFWKKKSILFELPYWEYNLLRHNLDVMHIEKNVCDNFISTLLDLDKSKDNLQARQDLIDIGIKSELQPQLLEDGSYLLPPTCFTMTKKEKLMLCEVLKNLKMPKGYASNISRCVNITECKIVGLKSHDCHVLIEDILPIALRSCSSSNEIIHIVVEISKFLKSICAKVINPNELDILQNNIVITLCKMERSMLPSFFTIMIHLLIHLAEEVKLGGPVQYRWMYPFERFFLVLKDYVANKAQPEGSIAEGYIAEEGIYFCSKYIDRSHFLNKDATTEEQFLFKFSSGGTPLGKKTLFNLDVNSLIQAHRYVLRHCDNLECYRLRFKDEEKRKRRGHTHLIMSDLERLINERFHEWLRDTVSRSSDMLISEEIKALAMGPNKIAYRYKGLLINTYTFHTKERDEGKKTQNFGVVNTTEIGNFSYYGKINDIIIQQSMAR